MSRAHERLSRNKWTGVDILTLVTDETAAYRTEDNITIEGPHVVLAPEDAQSFALTLHELATNAAKHGALSTARGAIDIRWRETTGKRGERRIVFRWHERCEHPITPPEHESFGLDTIRRQLAYDLRGKVRLDFQPTGLDYQIDFPMPLQRQDDTADPEAPAAEATGLSGKSVAMPL